MNVRFIDTSIMLNWLEVPGKCADKEQVKQEWRQVLANGELLIMPIATIIETGNHIAHIQDGTIRRKVSLRFQECLEKTAKSEAPWSLYGTGLDQIQIKYLAEHLDEYSIREIGIGDLTTIYAYEEYIKNTPALDTVMIWSTDYHMQGYRQENISMKRRRSR